MVMGLHSSRDFVKMKKTVKIDVRTCNKRTMNTDKSFIVHHFSRKLQANSYGSFYVFS